MACAFPVKASAVQEIFSTSLNKTLPDLPSDKAKQINAVIDKYREARMEYGRLQETANPRAVVFKIREAKKEMIEQAKRGRQLIDEVKGQYKLTERMEKAAEEWAELLDEDKKIKTLSD